MRVRSWSEATLFQPHISCNEARTCRLHLYKAGRDLRDCLSTAGYNEGMVGGCTVRPGYMIPHCLL